MRPPAVHRESSDSKRPRPRLKRFFSRMSSSNLRSDSAQGESLSPSASEASGSRSDMMTAAAGARSYTSSSVLLPPSTSTPTPAATPPRTLVRRPKSEAELLAAAANRLSAHFDMIEDVSEIRKMGPDSPLWIPPYRRVSYRPNINGSSPTGTGKRRLIPRLWDTISSASTTPRKKLRDIKFWPEFDIEAVEMWFPLDGEEGELVEDEGFLDALEDPNDPPQPHTISSSNDVDPNTKSFIPRRRHDHLDIISLLPPELSLHIFLLLDLPSLASSSAVCRYWNILSRDMQIWRELFYAQPTWTLDPARAARQRIRMNSRASHASSTFATPAALYNRWGRNSLLSLRSVWTGEAPSSSLSLALESPPLGLALDWKEMYRTRREIDRRWKSEEPKVNRLVGHTDSVYCLEYDQQKLLTGSRDRTIKVWSTSSGKLLTTLRGHEGSVLCLKFDSAANFMVSGSSDCRILVWDLAQLKNEGNVRPRKCLVGHTGGVLDLKLTEDMIVSCAKDTTVRLWSRTTLEPLGVLYGHTGPVNAIDVSRKSGRIISASGDGTLILWSPSTHQPIRTFVGHSRGLACVAFVESSPSSSRRRRRCSRASSNTTETDTREEEEEEEDELVISGSNDKTIRVWSTSTGECIALLEGHENLVRALAYDALTGRLVSASYDQTIILWQLKREWTAVGEDEQSHTGEEGGPGAEQEVRGTMERKRKEVVSAMKLRTFKNYHSSHIFDVKFDVGRILSASHDRKIVILDFAADLDASIFLNSN